jgi:hypothetical protein
MIYPELTDWIMSDDALPTLLVEVTVTAQQGLDKTLYLSTSGYVTRPTDSPASEVYIPCINRIGSVKETLSLTGTPALTAGDIELNNSELDLDPWLDYVWSNRDINVYLGDVSWPRAQFKLVFSGVVDDLSVRDRYTLNIELRSSLDRLNYPLSSESLEDGTPIPLAFGEVSNVTPVLKDASTLLYKVHTRAIGGIAEVRDSGVPVGFTVSETDSSEFTLNNQPFGTITCTVHGDADPVYVDDAASLIQRIATQFGNPSTRLQESDIDASAMSGFSATHPQCVGLYASGTDNTLSVMQELAASLGAGVLVDKFGKLSISSLNDPTGNPVMTVTDFDIEEGSFYRSDRLKPMPARKLAFNQNHTPQTDTAAGIPEAHRKEWAEEWKYVTAKNDTAAELFRISDPPEAEATNLQVHTDAQAEVTRRLSMFDRQRYIAEFEGLRKLLLVEVGDEILLEFSELETPIPCVVVSTEPDWVEMTTKMEVLL